MFTNHLQLLALFAATTTILHAGCGSLPFAFATEPAPKSILTGELGITVADAYNARGLVVHDEGTSFQPYLNLHANFYEGAGFINSAHATLGFWSDFSSTPFDNQGHEDSRFTEFDYGIGFSVIFADRWTFSSFHNRWTSPAAAYGDGRTINATLAFDDSGLIAENFSLKPYLIVLRDLGGEAPCGLVSNTWYFEPGIRPNYTLFSKSETPVNVALIIKAGLGHGFYDGETYGYFAAGPQVSVPLNFIDPSAGKWTASAGYFYYDFGRTLEEFNHQIYDHLVTFKLTVSF